MSKKPIEPIAISTHPAGRPTGSRWVAIVFWRGCTCQLKEVDPTLPEPAVLENNKAWYGRYGPPSVSRCGSGLKPGRCGTMTHDNKHHGTTTLFAALNVPEAP
jgi:hypothetical protein